MKKQIFYILITGLVLVSCAVTPISEQQKQKDIVIKNAIRKKYNSEKWFNLSGVDIQVYNGKVNLTGLVYNYDEEDAAYRDAGEIVGPANVSGAITVSYIGG